MLKKNDRSDNFGHLTGAIGGGASIGRNFVKSSLLLMVNIGIRYALQLVYLSLMTKMISPDIFGVVALASPIMSFFTLFSVNATGFLTMHKKDLSKETVDNHFWASMAFSVVLCVLALAITPVFAQVYRDARLLSIIPVLGIMFLLNPLIVQGRAILDRNLRFNNATGFETLALLVSYVCSLMITYKYRNQFGLVVQQVVVLLVTALLLLIKTGWIPRWPRKIVRLERADFTFVRNITISKIAQFLNANIDKLLIGHAYGMEQLGYYNNALKLNTIPVRQIRIPFSSFVIPSMIRYQNTDDRMSFFYNSMTVMMLVTFPLIVFFVVFADKIVMTVLGISWLECSSIVRIMGIYTFVTCILPQFEWYLIAMKKDRKQKWINVISATVNSIILVVLSRYAFRWFLVGYSLSAIVTFAIYLFFMSNDARYDVVHMLKVISPIVLIAISAAALVYVTVSARIVSNVMVEFVLFATVYGMTVLFVPGYRATLKNMVKRR